MIRKRTHARECAIKILYQVSVSQDEVEKALASFFEWFSETDPEVVSFATDLVEGTLTNVQSLDLELEKAAENWKLDRMALIDLNILRLGAYEIIYREDIPSKVTINESVNLAKKFSQKDSGKFVNGILDKIHRKHEKTKTQPKT